MNRDPLVKDYVPELTKLIQKDVFLDLSRPYSNLSLKFITEKIHASSGKKRGVDVSNLIRRAN